MLLCDVTHTGDAGFFYLPGVTFYSENIEAPKRGEED